MNYSPDEDRIFIFVRDGDATEHAASSKHADGNKKRERASDVAANGKHASGKEKRERMAVSELATRVLGLPHAGSGAGGDAVDVVWLRAVDAFHDFAADLFADGGTYGGGGVAHHRRAG